MFLEKRNPAAVVLNKTPGWHSMGAEQPALP